jgi:hypothetical protein
MDHPVKSQSQLRSNPIAKLSLAARHPLRKVFSTGSLTKSTATEETTQAVKFVRFSEKIRIRKTLSRKDYTLEETEATWSSREERQQISRQCRKEIKKINHGEKLKDNTYCCTRGLEGHTNIGKVSKARTRAMGISAVLDEQLTQWEEGVFDENTIADVYYHTVSSSCQKWAYLVGQSDHKAAKEILHESIDHHIKSPLLLPAVSTTNEALFMRAGAGSVR